MLTKAKGKERENVNMKSFEKEGEKDLSEGANDERHKIIAYKNSLGTRTTKSEKENIERVNKQIRSSRDS